MQVEWLKYLKIRVKCHEQVLLNFELSKASEKSSEGCSQLDLHV